LRIDLHIHTSVSDGSLEPAELVRAAHAAGLSLIAITDHDTTAGVPDALAAAPPQLRVIPGIELSCTDEGAEIHILGYFIDPNDTVLSDFAHGAVEWRRQRIHSILERLDALGVRVSIDDVLAAAGKGHKALGRPHVARALLRKGYVSSFSEAFDQYLAQGSPAYVPTRRLSPAEAIVMIHDAGGLAVWAHPSMESLEENAARFASMGLDGIECYRPQVMSPQRRSLESVARRHGLLRSGGSDWHGAWNGLLGTFAVRPAEVGRLLERGGVALPEEVSSRP